MQLCSNRPEGFGPSSSLSSPLTTSCFVDTILLPIPIWLALFLLPLLLAGTLHYRKTHFDPSTQHLRLPPTKPPVLYTIIRVLYYVLIVCNILMQTLEIVRLELLNFGIGLQPFSYVGLLLGAGLHQTRGLNGRIWGWGIINGILWFGGAIMNVVQAVGLALEGINGRSGSKYPVSDQVIDVAVMAGVYVVIGILGVVLVIWRKRRDTLVQNNVEAAGFVDLEPGKGNTS